jgi:two-component system, LuxR family, sensor kinase FixL
VGRADGKETRLRAIVDTTVDGIILIDEFGMVTLFNSACERMFGYDASEVVGQNVKKLMPPPYQAGHDLYLESYRRARERRIIGIGRVVAGRRKNGETFPLELSVGEGEDQGKTFYVGTLRDVTARQHEQEERERLIEELTTSNAELAHFVNVASHDLREPLRMVSAFCKLIEQSYGDRLDEPGREYVSLAVSGSLQMQALLDDLVTYGRLGLEAERNVWFDAGEAVDRVLDNLHEAMHSSGAEVTRDPLPKLYGNPIRFIRLLQNIVGNALKYVDPGVAPKVHIGAALERGSWRFAISDNGIGIDQRHFQRIFEPFKRLHTKATYQGTGLGLAICRKIIEGFGGDIWVRSMPGEGSTFEFTIKDHDQREEALS